MSLRLGLVVPQGWRMDLVGIEDPVEAYETMTRVAQLAEALNFDSIWLYDHFHTVPEPTQEITFECWTSTAALARDTKRIRIGQIVGCNGYRNPALLAKMASTIDVLSHGRLDFGIGAGWYEHEYRAYGYPYPDAPERLRMLREAVQVIKAMWTEEEAHFEGKRYQIRGAINQPKGVQKPHIPMMIGGAGEQVTLKLVAQYGDACNIAGRTNEDVLHKFAVLQQHCEKLGRDYQSIKRTGLYHVLIAETAEEVQEKAQNYSFFGDQLYEKAIVGTPDQVRQRLEELEALGFQELILFFPDSAKLRSIELFAKHCIQQ